MREGLITGVYGPYRGVVDSVHDGDTVNVKLDLGFDITIYARCRVKGINAPELSTDAGKQARDFARAVLMPGDKVEVTSYGWDKYGGRIDAIIMMKDPYTLTAGNDYTNFGLLMIDSGNAVPYNP